MADVTITPLEPAARYSIRARGVAPATLNIPMNTCVAAGNRILARLGPDEWLLLAEPAQADDLVREWNTALEPCEAWSLVDISHRNAALTISGRRAQEVINTGCPLDLYDASFPPYSATRTILGKAEIVLIRPSAELSYRLECTRSFAPYLHAFLAEAANA